MVVVREVLREVLRELAHEVVHEMLCGCESLQVYVRGQKLGCSGAGF